MTGNPHFLFVADNHQQDSVILAATMERLWYINVIYSALHNLEVLGNPVKYKEEPSSYEF